MNPMLAVKLARRLKPSTVVGIIIAIAVAMLLSTVMYGMMLATTLGNLNQPPVATLKPIGCIPELPGIGPIGKLGPRQTANAAVIIARGQALNVPPRGWVVAIATSMQESQLLNSASLANPASLAFPHDVVYAGDHDSVGLFQQRDGWGPMAVRMDPGQSADMFYTGGRQGQRGLLDINGWEGMTIARAAQAVQVSAFPDAYAKWETLAVNTVKALADTDLTGGCETVASGPWVNPLNGAPYRKTAGFGACSDLWSNCHTGQDMAIIPGTPIVAATAGKVIYAKWGGAYGNLVKLQHADNVQTWYAHMERSTAVVGTTVKPGDVIGYVGDTGNTTGPHLHFEVRLNDEPINPVPFMAGKGANL